MPFKKLFYTLFLGFLATLCIFLTFTVLPGDPAHLALGLEADELQLQAYRQANGLDQPLFWRFSSWFIHVLQGDLGTSLRYQRPVAQLLQDPIKVTSSLALLALFFTCFIAMVDATLQLCFTAPWLQISLTWLNYMALIVPQFLLGLALIYLFTLQWSLLKLYEKNAFFTPLILPAVALAVSNSAYLSRYVTQEWRGQMGQSYLQNASALGISRFSQLFIHGLKGALIPSISVLGLISIDLLGGSIIIESVFSLPGVGSLLLNAINSRDFPLIQAISLYFVVIVMILQIVIENIYYWVDPRLRHPS
jgi:peptide/nickel transport system permease protein